jgi:hypothetical protein
MDGQVTVEQLLAKIGQLVVQLDIANGRIAALQAEVKDLSEKAQSEKKPSKA